MTRELFPAIHVVDSGIPATIQESVKEVRRNLKKLLDVKPKLKVKKGSTSTSIERPTSSFENRNLINRTPNNTLEELQEGNSKPRSRRASLG
jgi:hypothetical protein